MATAAAVSASPTPSDGESTAAAVDDQGTTWRSLPTDAFAEILLRLPPSRRRLARLVCRHWRAVIDERTPAPGKPAVLACFTGLSSSASAYVIDDLAAGTARCRQVWGVRADPSASDERRRRVDVTVVGTCNGLVCVCDNTRPGGAVSLLNPATRETLRLPPLPVSHQGGHWSGFGSGKAYSFGFHPVTGRYRVLHLPCRADATGGFTSLQVFTLEDDPSRAQAWRDVPVSFPGGGATTATCSVDAGLVTVDGATYWVTKGAERVVSFDHEDERVAFAAPLPVEGGPGTVLRLTEVHGRLGFAVCADRPAPAKTDVWVLGRQGWSRQYSVQVQAGVGQRLAGPHIVHGEYVLTVVGKKYSRMQHLYAHRMRGAAGRLQSGEVRSLRIRDEGTVAAYCKDGFYYLQTFAYVETTEPLSVYKTSKLSS